RFRQWRSLTPGHPEYHLTAGVEASTGPLGQGVGNAVGMAIGEDHLAARYNRPGHEIFNHFTYALASDGDLMEGVQAEAASLAGHLQLGKLVVLYDSNDVTLSGSTSVTFTEDVAGRYRAYGWQVQQIADGNDLPALTRAIEAARNETTQPSLIIVKTQMAYGSPDLAGSARAREPAGRRGSEEDQAQPGLARRAELLDSARGAGALPLGAGARANAAGRLEAPLHRLRPRISRAGDRD